MNAKSFVLNDSFTIRLEMISDWHVGTGTGIPGSIDALIARDGEGFPCVPAKTIVGIWRDALETLALSLDGGEQKEWRNWVALIFGSQPVIDKNPKVRPSSSILSLQPARISKGLRERILSSGDLRLKQALTFIKPEIKIEEASGASETGMLRFAEMGRIGTVLESRCHLDFNLIENCLPAHRATISALLIASVKLVERIGGKRRRGAGRCKLTIVDAESTSEIIERLKHPDVRCPSLKPVEQHYEFGSQEEGGAWRRAVYTLKLNAPVSIVTATLGNVSESLDFIPGTYLLPHLTRGTNLFRHVARGDLQVSPATIEVNGQRGLPVPAVIYYDKVDGGFDKQRNGVATVYNGLDNADSAKINSEKRQVKNYRSGYLDSLGETGRLPTIQTRDKPLLMHNTVKDDVQRPTEDVGGVYSRQAIPAGTVLHGEIRFKGSLNLDFSDVGEEVRLGTSKKDDYGLAGLKIKAQEDVISVAKAEKTLVVYLESDLLLRDSALRQTNLVPVLQEELQNKLSENLNHSVNLSDEGSLIQTRRIESWQESWGFPRPTLIAMRAGSCAKFEIKNFDSFDQGEIEKITKTLQIIEQSGIGERRGEGYGRIRFNPSLLMGPINNWTVTEEHQHKNGDAATSALVEEEMTEFAKQIETTAWREELRRAVLLIADEPKLREEIFGFEWNRSVSIPPLSQIGGLRSVVTRLKDNSQGSKDFVTDWLTHLELTKNRIEKWDKNENEARATNQTKKIKQLVSDDQRVWRILFESEAENKGHVWQPPKFLVRTEDQLQKELWAEAVRALLDACARAHKRDGGE